MVRYYFFAVLLAAVLPSTVTSAAPKIGEKPPKVVLDGEDGGRVSGGAWDSDSIASATGKVWSFFYVDPDYRNDNEQMTAALKAANLPADKYASMSVINMDATWLPNSVIASSLADKQKEFPDTVFAKDMKKTLVKKWGLKDDAYVTMVFDKTGVLRYMKEGEFSETDIKEMIAVIRKAIAE